MSNEYKIYVAQSPNANLYLKDVLAFLRGNQDWMEAAKPSIDEVRKQLVIANERKSRWTNDKKDADIWDDYTIKLYQKFLPEVEFIEVSLTTEPILVKKPKV